MSGQIYRSLTWTSEFRASLVEYGWWSSALQGVVDAGRKDASGAVAATAADESGGSEEAAGSDGTEALVAVVASAAMHWGGGQGGDWSISAAEWLPLTSKLESGIYIF